MGDKPGRAGELEDSPTRSLEESGESIPPLLRELARTPDVFVGSLAQGSLVGKRYRIERLLGKGGMGTVYLAVDTALGKEVALKLVEEAISENVERLRDEVLLAHEVTHRNVCRTYDLEEVDDRWLVKMEYVDGETLAARVAAGRLSVGQARAIGRQIALGLAAAHERGVVHRDLKPQNIMIERNTGRVVLMDFGLARLSQLAGRAADGVTGTPEFMAPEQARGREVDGRADLYALGCVLYYMLTGRVVFPAQTARAAALRQVDDPPPDPRSVRPEIPSWLARLILRLLEKDPARRPADAAEVAAALGGRPRRWRLASSLVLLAAAIGGVGFIALRRPPPEWRAVVRDLVPTYDENANEMAFSPDGKLIAYSSDRSGGNRIFVDSLADGSSRAISPPGLGLWSPRWTRDGRAILAYSNLFAIHRVPIEGSAPDELAQNAMFPEDCAGRLLFVSRGSPECVECPGLVLREADGRERDVVRFTAKFYVWNPRCDAAGRRVVYTLAEPTSGAPSRDLWVAPLDGGSPRQLTHDGLDNGHGSFHPDGNSIVYSSARAGHRNLWEMALDGGAATQLTFDADTDMYPDVSPDGRAIAYQLDFTSYPLFAYGLLGGERRRVTSRYEILTSVRMTPDGQEIVAGALRGKDELIVAIDVQQGGERTLAEGRTPAVGPDGREIFYSVAGSPTRVYALARAGGSQRLVTEVSRPIMILVAGADGQLHMGVRDEKGTEAWRAPLSGGASEREAPAPWGLIMPAPSGDWRAGIALDGADRSIHFWPPGTSLDQPAARVLRAHGPGSVHWDAGGQTFVYAQGSKIHRLVLSSGEDHVLLDTGVKHAIHSLAVSPDGNTIFLPEQVAHTRRKLITNFGERLRPR